MGPAAAGLLGTGITSALSLIGGERARRQTEASTREQMAFQERMSSTAHTREVADLRKAGLNPILSANRGASSPSGSSYVASDVATPAVNTALATLRLRQELKNMRATEKNLESSTLANLALGELRQNQAGVIGPAARVGEAATTAWDTAMEVGNRFQRWATDKLMGLYRWSAADMSRVPKTDEPLRIRIRQGRGGN